MKKKQDENRMTRDFVLCGLCGWCIECLFTGICSLFGGKDRKLSCNTSIWMFPIYGMAAFISPISRLLKDKGTILRGCIYTIGIFITEFSTGELLKRFKACPWDYSKARFNLDGIIRLDFAPLWFFVGLFYENMLTSKGSRKIFYKKRKSGKPSLI